MSCLTDSSVDSDESWCAADCDVNNDWRDDRTWKVCDDDDHNDGSDNVGLYRSLGNGLGHRWRHGRGMWHSGGNSRGCSVDRSCESCVDNSCLWHCGCDGRWATMNSGCNGSGSAGGDRGSDGRCAARFRCDYGGQTNDRHSTSDYDHTAVAVRGQSCHAGRRSSRSAGDGLTSTSRGEGCDSNGS